MPTAKGTTVLQLGRIETQIRGLAEMIKSERDCVDVLRQVSAVKTALATVQQELLEAHAATCIEHIVGAGDAGAQRRELYQLIELFECIRR